MPAHVTVAAGTIAGKQLWIEKQVLRIGSDPDADLCLPSSEIESQVVMVEYDRGKYVVYNRSARDLLLADRPLPAGKNYPWNADQELDVGGGYRLVLKVEGNPAPAPRRVRQQITADEVSKPEPTDAPAPGAPGAAPPEADGGGSMLVQAGVIAICVVGCIAMVLFAPKKGETTKTSDCPPFTKVVEELQKSKIPGAFLKRVQEAEDEYGRGRPNSAREKFLQLRDEALKWKGVAGEKAETEELVLKYLKCRISKLTK